MKKKNVILMASLSLFAMNCSTLQENLSSEKRNNKVKWYPICFILFFFFSIMYLYICIIIRIIKEKKISDLLGFLVSIICFLKNQRLLISGTSSEIRTVKLQNALLKSFENWKGTRYAFGGDSSRGIDCSALTRRVYREVFSFELPRVTKDQIKVGRHVSRNNLKPGDILYFRPDGKYNHTAVYLGNSLFINASSSKGVILSSMEHSYWSKYFVHGVRVDTASANV